MDPLEVQGTWRRGWTLDVHTISSEFTGYDANGNPQFDTKRSELGELIYQLKYRGKQTASEIAEILAGFFSDKPNGLARIDILIPVPPSTVRTIQPVHQITQMLALKLNKDFASNAVTKTKRTPGLKGIQDPEKRRELLDDAFKVDGKHVRGKGVLLVDDLYRSGATANAVTVAIMNGGAARVYFLAATRTRSKL
jgi:predicted amidophosphoribosyltransferase